MDVTKILGSEHDIDLTNAALQALGEHGADEVSRNWAVAGSQEISRALFSLNGSPLTLEAETYVGLSLTGERSIVDAVSARVAEIQK